MIAAARGVAAHEILDQLRQHRDDDAEREHVEQDGDEDERESGAPRRARAVGSVMGAQLATFQMSGTWSLSPMRRAASSVGVKPDIDRHSRIRCDWSK